MKLKETIAFTVFLGSMLFYELFPITCTVVLLISLAGIYRMAKESEKKGEI